MKTQIIVQNRTCRAILLIALMALIAGFLAATTRAQANTPNLPDDLKQQAQGKMVLLDFYSAFCGTCRMMEPHVRTLEKTARDLQVDRIDMGVANSEKYANLYNVQGTPTYVLFNRQGQPLYRMENLLNPFVLEKQVLRLTGKLKSVPFPSEVSLPTAAPVADQPLKNMILVSFENAQCAACKDMAPYLQGFELSGQQGLRIVRLDTAEPGGKKLMRALSIKELPAFVLLDDSGDRPGHGELLRMTGSVDPHLLWTLIRLFGDAGV